MDTRIVLRFLLMAPLVCSHLLFNAQVKSISATKINQSVKIDGNLDDAIWQNMEPVTDFITSTPNFGKVSTHKTLVKIAYDNSAVYVGAYLYDNPNDIRKQFTQRDLIDRQDVDIFVVGFDTYHDRQNAFIFRVTAAGVQADAKESRGGEVFDRTWDAVWESQVSIKADGWVAEIKIPFSAIRFSKNKIQDWGINFARFVRRENENSIWNPEDPKINGDINQWGDWVGLKDITPPLRLSFQPYISGGARISPTAKGDVTEILKSGGMDVKYGINESFTLDMTLIPDFAQVQSDNTLLNLTPFEVKFDDYRPFFTEGTELFNKAGLFYSRRVGAAPGGTAGVLRKYGNNPAYKIDKNPGITRLYNATKFSGRNKNNLGIGVFNAVAAPMYAKITAITNGKDSSILTEPFTNYNIFVLDQALKNRSSISFTNTNVLRRGNSRNANVSSIDLSLFDKKNTYNFTIAGKYSAIWGNNENKNGFRTITNFGKVSGIIQYNAALNVESDKYDPNDLGFLLNNNSLQYSGNISYNLLKPTTKFLNQRYGVRFNNSYLYKPFNWTGLEVGGSAFLLFKNFWDINFEFQGSPLWSNDYFVNSNSYNGYFLKRSPYYYLGINGSTDSRKKLFFDVKLGGAESPLPNDPFFISSLLIRYRFNNKFQLSGSMAIEQDKGNWGWSQIRDTNGIAVIAPIIARRNTKTNTSIVTAQYSFTRRMNLSVRGRHYWSAAENTNFYTLKNDGYWDEIPFIKDKNINYNTFNIDMFYTWDFLLGSRITLAWKNALGGNVGIDAYNNSTYGKNLGQSISNPHSNEVTLKIVYFLDYLNLKKKK
jgi:Domain of unknown function (DUF5916)/Carbohydrate family 9 binding domain-like